MTFVAAVTLSEHKIRGAKKEGRRRYRSRVKRWAYYPESTQNTHTHRERERENGREGEREWERGREREIHIYPYSVNAP